MLIKTNFVTRKSRKYSGSTFSLCVTKLRKTALLQFWKKKKIPERVTWVNATFSVIPYLALFFHFDHIFICLRHFSRFTRAYWRTGAYVHPFSHIAWALTWWRQCNVCIMTYKPISTPHWYFQVSIFFLAFWVYLLLCISIYLSVLFYVIKEILKVLWDNNYFVYQVFFRKCVYANPRELADALVKSQGRARPFFRHRLVFNSQKIASVACILKTAGL